MAANPERLLHAWHYPHPWASTPAVIYGFTAILTIAVGGLGLVAPSPLRQIVDEYSSAVRIIPLRLNNCALSVVCWAFATDDIR
jgi:hypothetical protein